MEQEEGSKPSIERVAKEMGKDPRKVDHLIQVAETPASLDAIDASKEGKTRLRNTIQDKTTPSPEETLGKKLMTYDVRRGLYRLNNQERKVLHLRFGLFDKEPLTLKEVGEIMRLSRERIRQIEAQALEKLRNNPKNQPLRIYLEGPLRNVTGPTDRASDGGVLNIPAASVFSIQKTETFPQYSP